MKNITYLITKKSEPSEQIFLGKEQNEKEDKLKLNFEQGIIVGEKRNLLSDFNKAHSFHQFLRQVYKKY